MAGDNLLEFTPEPASSRIEQLLTATSSRPTPTVSLPGRSLDQLRNEPIPTNPDLLRRLQSFLPAIQQSNHDLQQQARANPASLNIENLDPSAAHYIEMNLGLGVYESRADPSRTSDSSSTDDSTSSSSSSSSDSDLDSDSDSDASSNRPDVLSVLMAAVPPVPRVPARPDIVILNSHE